MDFRIENLKNKTESADESRADDAFYTREAEITELESLVPEIQEKIQDTKDMKEQNQQNQAEESGFTKSEYFIIIVLRKANKKKIVRKLQPPGSTKFIKIS